MSFEVALQRIEACFQSKQTALDLSGLGLNRLPDEITKLHWLEDLDCSETESARWNLLQR